MTGIFNRRKFLKSVGIGLASTGVISSEVGLPSVAAQEESDSWPQFGPDNGNTGYFPNHTEPGTEVVEQWHFPELGSVNNLTRASDGTVFVGDSAGHVVALEEGTELWRFNANDRVSFFPTVHDGVVYVGGSGGMVYALDAETGAELWHFEAGGRISSPPTVADGTVFVNDRDLYALDARDGSEQWHLQSAFVGGTWLADGMIYTAMFDGVVAVDATTGTEEWNVEMDVSNDGGLPALTVSEGSVYVGTSDGQLHALDASNGGEQWTFQMDGPARNPPTVIDDTVYVGGLRLLYALEATDGSERWSFEPDPGGSLASKPRTIGDTVYVSIGSTIHGVNVSDGTEQWNVSTQNITQTKDVGEDILYVGTADLVLGLDASDGTEQWQFEFNARMNGLVYANDTIYTANNNGDVYGINALEGTEKWQFEADDRIRSSPAVSDGSVYVGSMNNYMYAIDAETGQQQWQFETGSFIQSAPKVVDETVYFGSVDNNVYALDVDDGSEEWSFETSHRIHTSPAITSSQIFVVTHDHTIYALNRNGSELWNVDIGDGLGSDSSPAVTNETVYVVGDNGNTVYALDTTDGREKWHFEPERVSRNISPAVTDEKLFLPEHIIDIKSGEEEAFVELPPIGAAPSSPVVGEDAIYFSNVAIDRSDLTEQWMFDFAIGVQDTPVVVDGTVYLGSEDGRVYAIGDGVAASMSVPQKAMAGGELSFSAEDSRTTDTITTYEWAFDEEADFTEGDETVTHTFDDPGPTTVRLRVTDSEGRTDTVSRLIYVHEEEDEIPPIIGDRNPQDLDGDGLYEDVNGDDSADVVDVQALQQNLGSDVIQNHSEAFNFAGDAPEEVTQADVEALYDRVTGGDSDE